MKTSVSGLLTLVLFALIAVSSCRNNDTFFDGELQTSIDNSFVSSEFANIRNMVDLEAMLDTSVYKNGIYCPFSEITITTSGNTATMVLDFGSGSTCIDGRLRGGKLICTFVGKWRNQGSVVSVEPDGYTVQGFPMEFEKTITNLGRNADNNLEFQTEVVDAVVYTSVGNITWASNYVSEWVGGEGTPFNLQDNEYLITGSASGRARNLENFTSTIEQPLHVKTNCQHIVDGVLALTPENRTTRTITYGDGSGSCDNQAVLSVGTYQTTLTLP